MAKNLDAIERLHTTLVDSCRGYVAAVEKAEDTAMYQIADEALALHRSHAGELRDVLASAGRDVELDGTIMGTVHVAAVTLRSTIVGLDRTALKAFIDGEERNLKAYDEALGQLLSDDAWMPMLMRQREALSALVGKMRRRSEPVIA